MVCRREICDGVSMFALETSVWRGIYVLRTTSALAASASRTLLLSKSPRTVSTVGNAE